MRSVARFGSIIMAGALALAACGGDSGNGGTAADVYVEKLCGAFAPFMTALKDVPSGADLSDGANAKQALVDYLTGAADAAGDTVKSLKGAGAPDIVNGEEGAAAVVTAFEKAEDALNALADQADGLAADDPTAIATEFTKLAADAQTALGEAMGGLEGLKSSKSDSDKMDKLFSETESCKAISGA